MKVLVALTTSRAAVPLYEMNSVTAKQFCQVYVHKLYFLRI
jgi:hypothetical protein